MTFKEKIIKALTELKLDIVNAKNEKIAYLELVTESDVENKELIDKITIWREQYKSCFLSEFNPTFDRTKQWLNNAVIQSPDRLMFKIFTNDNLLVGHIGAIFRENLLEYDYYVLGVKVEIKDFALTIARKFLLWIIEVEQFDYIYGNTRSDNYHAIDFHLRTGFVIHNEVPLKKMKISDSEFIFEKNLTITNSDVRLVEIRANKFDLLK